VVLCHELAKIILEDRNGPIDGGDWYIVLVIDRTDGRTEDNTQHSSETWSTVY